MGIGILLPRLRTWIFFGALPSASCSWSREWISWASSPGRCLPRQLILWSPAKLGSLFLLYSKVTPFHMCVYMCIHEHACKNISYSFLLWFITGYWIQFPVLHSKTLLFISPKCTSFHLLIPSSNPSFPHLISPLATRSLLSMSLRLFLQHIPLNQIFTLILLKWLEY